MALLTLAAPAIADDICRAGASRMSRVELYFGARPGDAGAWRRFLKSVVTPRFPDGLTEIEGAGQWRGPQGLLRERTHVLVIYYRPDAAGDARIEAIRTLYKTKFAQRSVLRIDSTACVGF